MKLTIETLDNAFLVHLERNGLPQWTQAFPNLTQLFSVLFAELQRFGPIYEENLEHNRQLYPAVIVLPLPAEDAALAAAPPPSGGAFNEVKGTNDDL